MKQLKYKTLAFLGLLMPTLLATPALAAPAEVASVIHAMAPYGSGAYSVLFITAYDTELWTDAPRWSMNVPFALTLRYHMGFSADYLVSRSLKEIRHVDPSISDATIESYRKAMAFFQPASSGDEITVLFQPGQPTRFFKNGAPTGEVSVPSFSGAFSGIWLSPGTSDSDLRKSLLKLN